MGRDQIVVEMNVAPIVGSAEKAIERCVIGQVLSGGELQLQECDVGRVEIDRVDACRVRDEIAHDIAAAGGDRHDAKSAA